MNTLQTKHQKAVEAALLEIKCLAKGGQPEAAWLHETEVGEDCEYWTSFEAVCLPTGQMIPTVWHSARRDSMQLGHIASLHRRLQKIERLADERLKALLGGDDED